MRILLVEDDPKIASFVTKGLTEEGFGVVHAADGETGLDFAIAETFELAIVDIMLPGRDGLSLIEELRRRRINLPVIILSARRSVDDRVRGFQTGGDDYLTKPFALSELLARVQALIRRSHNVVEPQSLTVDDLSIDFRSRRVTRAGKRIDLQPRELSLLEYLMRNAGRVVSKSMLIEHVWDYNFDLQTNVVESRVCRLRDKVDRGFDVPLIHTVRGVGYVLRRDTD